MIVGVSRWGRYFVNGRDPHSCSLSTTPSLREARQTTKFLVPRRKLWVIQGMLVSSASPDGTANCGLATRITVNRDRGAPRGASPPTPPGIRVRTTAVRRIKL